MIQINTQPSARELRWFGLLLALFLGIVGGMAQWRFGAPQAARAIWVAAGVITILYFAIAPLRRYVYLGWVYATYPIGWVVSHVVLLIVYFLVITPIGAIMRLIGRDPLQRKLEPERSSYWVEHRPPRAPDRYFRQF